MNLCMFILYLLHMYECVCKCTPLCAYTCVCAHVESTETGWMSSSAALLLLREPEAHHCTYASS